MGGAVVPSIWLRVAHGQMLSLKPIKHRESTKVSSRLDFSVIFVADFEALENYLWRRIDRFEGVQISCEHQLNSFR
jgi:hypothetical protein